jgi:hypothetical protein
VLVIVAGMKPIQLNVPPSQLATNCTLAVGSRSSVSGDSKSRVVSTNSVPCLLESSSHSCGTVQKAEAVSSKKSVLSAVDVDGENANIAIRADKETTIQCRRAEVVLNMFEPPQLRG